MFPDGVIQNIMEQWEIYIVDGADVWNASSVLCAN